MSTFTQRVFYRELLSVLKHKKCQVIIATHSGVALASVIETYDTELDSSGMVRLLPASRKKRVKIDAKFIRANPKKIEDRNPMERDFLVNWPNLFPVHLYFHYLSTAWLCLNVSKGFFLKVLMAPVLLFKLGYDHSTYGRSLLWIIVGLFAVSVLPPLALIASDFANLINIRALETHSDVIATALPISIASFALLILFSIFLMWRGRGQ